MATNGKTLDDLAPWPGMHGPATAGDVAKYETVLALAASYQSHGEKSFSREWTQLVSMVSARFAIAFLLRKLAEHAPAVADEAASEVRDYFEDSEPMEEVLEDWAAEWGINPREVERIAQDMAEKWKAAQLKENAGAGRG